MQNHILRSHSVFGDLYSKYSGTTNNTSQNVLLGFAKNIFLELIFIERKVKNIRKRIIFIIIDRFHRFVLLHHSSNVRWTTCIERMLSWLHPKNGIFCFESWSPENIKDSIASLHQKILTNLQCAKNRTFFVHSLIARMLWFNETC